MSDVRRVQDLRPHPDNAAIYGDRIDDGLAESIRTRGVLTPLLITTDGLIVSGHRRWEAARRARLAEVPIALFGSEDDLDIAEALIEANRQRDKTTEQRTREFTRQKEIEAERAKRRMVAGARSEADPEATLPQGRAPQARDSAAAKVGMGARTAEKAAEVVAAIDGLETRGEQAEATALRKTLNAKSVHAAHTRARKAGYVAAPPPPPPPAAAPPAGVRLLEIGAPIPAEWESWPVDLTVTSPPFALRIGYADGGDVVPDDYRAFMHTWMREIHRVTAMGGRLALNVPLDVSLPETYPTFAIAMEAAMRAQWYYRFSIVWNEGHVSRSVARGSVDSASAPHVIAPVEMVAVFYKGGYEGVSTGDGPPLQGAVPKGTPGTAAKPDGRMWGWKRTPPTGVRSDLTHDEWLEWTNGLWTFPGESRPWEGHPAAFPEELPHRLIKLLSFPGDTVFDPFMGSGTTGIAALRLGRRFIGFDRSPTYVASARRRFAAAFG